MFETRPRIRRYVAGLLAVALSATSAVLGTGAEAVAAPRLVTVSGTGSTWSQGAVDAWRAAVKQFGMTVNYGGGGSTVGRNNYRDGTVDFAVSEIPYGQDGDSSPSRAFAYMPIVAGGTSLMYHLKIGGKLVTNLRLSGEVITKIFTAQITMWNDPAIKADNPGLALPAQKIVPVVRSDGSGTTAQFVTWMNKQHGAIWQPYCQRFGKSENQCRVLSFYPKAGGFVAQSGSQNIAGYVAQQHGEGAITYVEYSYALKNRFPVAKVLNAAGYYVEPTASNVAVALTKAEINPVDLTQNLEGVYRFTDKRTYPLSSYSYMILPVNAPSKPAATTEDKGYTIGRFSYYLLCQGQQSAEPLGYSPLPINLVKAGLTQVRKLPGVAVENIDISQCKNPTFSADGTNTLVKNAKNPQECDKKGSQQCATGTGGAPQGTNTNSNGGSSSNNSKNNNSTGQKTDSGKSSGKPGNTTAPATADQQVDPDTGEVITDGGSGEGGGTGQYVAGVPVSLEAEGDWRLRHSLMLLAVILLVALILGPPLIVRYFKPSRAGVRGHGR